MLLVIDSLEYLFYSQIVCWTIIFIYLFLINRKLKKVGK
ncbi:CcmD family protein [bacterium]|nr:CcmD family protein [bacterium]